MKFEFFKSKAVAPSQETKENIKVVLSYNTQHMGPTQYERFTDNVDFEGVDLKRVAKKIASYLEAVYTSDPEGDEAKTTQSIKEATVSLPTGSKNCLEFLKEYGLDLNLG